MHSLNEKSERFLFTGRKPVADRQFLRIGVDATPALDGSAPPPSARETNSSHEFFGLDLVVDAVVDLESQGFHPVFMGSPPCDSHQQEVSGSATQLSTKLSFAN